MFQAAGFTGVVAACNRSARIDASEWCVFMGMRLILGLGVSPLLRPMCPCSSSTRCASGATQRQKRAVVLGLMRCREIRDCLAYSLDQALEGVHGP